MSCLPRVVFVAVLVIAAGCSPAFNWRTVRADAPGLELLLPCKPDKGTRSVPLAGQPVEMSMLGCDAGDATFAVAWAPVPPGIDVGDALNHWKTATLAHLHATPSPADTRPAAFIPPGALPVPQALRMVVVGQRANGAPVVADAAWFAQMPGNWQWRPRDAKLSSRAFAALASGRMGQAAIGTVVNPGTTLVLQAIAEVKRDFPDILIQVEMDYNRPLVAKLLYGGGRLRTLICGGKITLQDHTRSEFNGEYVLMSVRLQATREEYRAKFTAFNVGGGLIWVLGIVTSGYFFGNIPWVRENLEKIIWAMILIPGLLAIYGAWRAGRSERKAP